MWSHLHVMNRCSIKAAHSFSMLLILRHNCVIIITKLDLPVLMNSEIVLKYMNYTLDLEFFFHIWQVYCFWNSSSALTSMYQGIGEGKGNGNWKVSKFIGLERLDPLIFLFPFHFPPPNPWSKYALAQFLSFELNKHFVFSKDYLIASGIHIWH